MSCIARCFLLIGFVSFLSACGGGGGGSATATAPTEVPTEVPTVPSVYSRFAFVTNADSNTVYTYATDSSTGNMKLVSSAQTGASPATVAVHPNNRYVYIPNVSDDNISQYSVNTDGSLTPMTTPTVAAENAPFSMVINTTGDFAYVVNVLDESISQYSINADGSLSALAMPTVTAGSQPYAIVIDSLSRYAYVTNIGSNDISQFTIGRDGSLTPMATPTILSGGIAPASIILDSTDSIAYVVNFSDETIGQFTVGSDGSLNLRVATAVNTGPVPVEIVIDSENRYAYVTNRDDGTISQYTMSSSGLLTPMSTPTIFSGGDASAITIDANNEYAYVLNRNDNTMSQYKIGSDGALTPNTLERIATGSAPLGIALTSGDAPLQPVSKFAYVTTIGSEIIQYSVEADGTLAALPLPVLSTGTSSFRVHVHPTNKYAYALSTTDNTVSQYRIADSGQLAPLSVSTVSVSPRAQHFILHPGGEFAYVINSDILGSVPYSVSQFAITSNGSLNLLSTFDFPSTFESVLKVAISHTGRLAFFATEIGVVKHAIGTDGLFVSSIFPAGGFIAGLVLDIELHSDKDNIHVISPSITGYQVNGFSYNTFGHFDILPGSTVQLDPLVSSRGFSFNLLETNPQGDFFYSILGPGGTEQFELGSAGQLSPQDPKDFVLTDTGPGRTINGITFEATGNYAYIPDSDSNEIDQYEINANGGFVIHSTPTMAAGVGPISISTLNRYE